MPISATTTIKRRHINSSKTHSNSPHQSSQRRQVLRTQLFLILLLIICLLTFFILLHHPQFSKNSLQSQITNAQLTPTTKSNPVIIVTAVNYAFRHYAANLRCSLLRVGIQTPPLIFALDSQTHAWATKLKWPVLLVDSDDTNQTEAVFGSKSFNLLSKRKLRAVAQVLRTGVDVLFVDADIIWCANAAAIVSNLIHTSSPYPPHLLFQTAWPRSFFNSGFYYARAHPDTIKVFDAFLAHDSDAENDQVIVNRVLCREKFGGGELFDNSTNRLIHSANSGRKRIPAACTWKGKVMAKVLDPALFPTGGEIINGQKLFHHPRRTITQMCKNGNVAILHNNCILSAKKKPRFVVKGMWYVHDELEDDSGRCRAEAAPATMEMRKRCGAAKCGQEGDVSHFPDLEM